MHDVSKEVEKLKSVAKVSLRMSPHLKQILAQVEASLSREEDKKVIQKIKNN